MGKNQGFKSSQAGRYNDSDAAGTADYSDGLKDVSFHSAEWHNARIAHLMKEKPTWDEWKQKRKEEEDKLVAVEEEEERRMRLYKAQLEANRARIFSQGADQNRPDKKKERKLKKKEKKESKKRKKSKHDSSSSSGSDSSDSSDGEYEKAGESSKRSRSDRRTSAGPRVEKKSTRERERGSGKEKEKEKEVKDDRPIMLSELLRNRNLAAGLAPAKSHED